MPYGASTSANGPPAADDENGRWRMSPRTIRPLLGIPMRWRSRIEAYDPPHAFEDVQVRQHHPLLRRAVAERSALAVGVPGEGVPQERPAGVAAQGVPDDAPGGLQPEAGVAAGGLEGIAGPGQAPELVSVSQYVEDTVGSRWVYC